MQVTPHPKPERRKGNRPRRIVDQAAVRRARLAHPECAACGARGENGHHVVGKDQFGDDVEANIISICGTGTSRCHGAAHGTPYTAVLGPDTVERRTAAWVNWRIGEHLVAHRPDVIAYVLEKKGDVAGRDFLHRVYRIASLP